MTVLLDDPVNSAEDVLGRSTLAKSIFALITEAPGDWTLRVGVYGKWGEGKSTILNLIEELAHAKELPVARFNPSLTGDTATLWNELALAIVRAFEVLPSALSKKTSVITKIRATLGSSQAIPGAFKVAKGLHPVAETVAQLVESGASVVRERIGISEARLATLVRGANRRLIVFVDDVDRVEPALVPKLLLKLRDLNIPLTAFVVAIDPDVVTEGLQVVHPGWKDAPEFLEKILQFHFWLHPPDRSAIVRLGRLQIPNTGLDIPADVVDEIADALPSNPRKLKEFFRSLWQIGPVVRRHGSDEIEWSLLLLLELMRTEAPLFSWSLFQSERFRKSAAVSTFFEKTSNDEQKNSVRTDLDEELANAEKRQPLSSPERERIAAIVRKLGGTSLTTEDRIQYWSQIRDSTPWVTLKEARELTQAWNSTAEPTRLARLVKSHADRVGVTPSQAARGLFRQSLALRQECLSGASNSELVPDLHDYMSDAQMYLGLLTTICDECGAFHEDRWGFDADDFMLLFKQFSSWAHFTNTDPYRDARRNERDLILRVASRAGLVAAEVLDRLDFLNSFSDPTAEPEAKALKEQLVKVLLTFVIRDVRARFEREEGIASMWNSPHKTLYNHVLLSPNVGLYTPDFIGTIGSLAERAKKDFTIQKNLIELLRAMVSSYSLSSGEVLSPDAKARLEHAATFIPVVWQGAVASPIQPRLLGSLKEGREKLLALFQPFGVQLPTPTWWDLP